MLVSATCIRKGRDVLFSKYHKAWLSWAGDLLLIFANQGEYLLFGLAWNVSQTCLCKGLGACSSWGLPLWNLPRALGGSGGLSPLPGSGGPSRSLCSLPAQYQGLMSLCCMVAPEVQSFSEEGEVR